MSILKLHGVLNFGLDGYTEVFFWATHQGAEIDLIIRRGGELYGVECKHTDTPRLTPSIRIALDDLNLRKSIMTRQGSIHFLT